MFVVLTADGMNPAAGPKSKGTPVTEVPDSEVYGPKRPEAVPEAPPEVASNRVPVIAVSLAALTIIGATIVSLPNFGRSALPVFRQMFSSSDTSSDFSRLSPPKPKRVAAMPPPLVPDPVVRDGLRDIQASEQQNADTLQKNTEALAALTQGSATQAADLKRITRQLALLSAQVNSLQNPAAAPLTTSSLGGPLITSGMPRPNPRARIIHASRKTALPPVPPPPVIPAVLSSTPPLAKPVGPVSVGGAPLSPAPASGSDAS